MASKEEEIQETIGFQSLKVNSPELPRTGRRTSVRRAGLGEETKIEQQKPLHRSRRAAAKDSEVTEMASKENEVEEKDVPTIFPKTPATRKDVKGVGAQSSRRRAKKSEEVEDHTETPKAVEAKGGKAIGVVVTRRSTRLFSRKAMEETATTQSKSRSSSKENAAVKMEALAKEDTVEKEKEEEKKDLVEYGDSCAVIVEEHGKKDQEVKNHELPPSIDGEDSKGVIENECEATHRDVPMIQQKKQLSTRTQSRRVSSKKPMEEKSSKGETFKIVALIGEDGEKQGKKEEKKDLVEDGDSCAVIVEEHGKKDQETKSHELPPFIEVDSKGVIENECEATHGDVPMIQQKQLSTRTQSRRVSSKKSVEEKSSEDENFKMVASKKSVEEKSSEDENFKMVALTDEDGEKQGKEEEKKDLVEYGDSCAVIVEEHGKKDQEAKSHELPPSIDGDDSKGIIENECEATHRDVPMIQQKKQLSTPTQSRRVSSKKPMEEKSSKGETFKIVALIDEDGEKQGKEEEKKDLAEKSDLVEEDAEKDKKVEIRSYSSFIEMENRESIVALVEEVEENGQEVEIHDFSSSTQGKGSNIEVETDDSIVVFVEGDKMKDQKVESREYSSSIEVENGDSVAALVEEVEENDQEVKIHGFSSSAQRVDSNIEVQNGDSTVVLVKGGEMKDQKVEINGFSSSIEIENKESIVALVEEVEEKDQEVESHNFSFSTQGKGSNIEVENDDSIVVFVEGDEMKDQKVESQEYSSSIEVENGDFIAALDDVVEENDQEVKIHGFPSSVQRVDSNIVIQNDDSTVVLVKGGEMKDQRVEIYDFSSSIEVENGDSIIAVVEKDEENDQDGEIHGSSFSSQKDSNIKVDEAFEFTKEAGDQPPENEHVKDSGNQSPENEYVEVSSDPSPENKAIEYCGDQSPENDLVESNQGSEFVEVFDDLLPTNEAVEDSGDHSSLMIRPLPHQEAIVCSQGSNGIEEEEEKLSLLFTEMTLKEVDECVDALLEPVVAQDASFVSIISPAPIAIRQDADHVATTDIVIPQDDCSLPTNEAVEDFGDHSNAKLPIPAGLDCLLCSEIRPLPHEEAIVCSQGSGEIEEEEGKLSLVFTEKTLKEPNECSDALLEPVVIRQDADHVATADIVIPQDDCSSPILSPAMVSLNQIPCESETMFLIEPSIVQTRSSEEAGGMAATEIEEEKEETKIKALEEEVFLKDENLELLSLTKLRAMYKQMLNGTKNEQERKKSIIKQDENCKQKLNDDMIKLTKSPLIKQEDLECLSRSKLDSNCKQKLIDDKIKSEKKRTPLKNLNYNTF